MGKPRTRVLQAVTTAFCLGSGLGVAQATLVLAVDVTEMTHRSERIVVGEVVGVTAHWDARHEKIATSVEVSVSETWKGSATTTVTVEQDGGSVDGLEMHIPGSATFSVGEHVLLFLRNNGSQTLSPVGMAQGKRALNFDRATARWMAGPADRSAAVKIVQGRMVPAQADSTMPLDDLRALVRKAMHP